MASRKDTHQRRQILVEELRRSCQDGSLRAGEPLPPVRDLISRYNVSHRIVNEAVQSLTEEGLLYSLPRKGTFVGRPNQAREGLYLLITEHEAREDDQLSRLQFGFEEQISTLGGTCLTLTLETLNSVREAARSLAPAGIFFMGNTGCAPGFDYGDASCARVYFSEQHVAAAVNSEAGVAPADSVFFDNESGGYQVTHYLLEQGHERIAFLGLHGEGLDAGPFVWSRERASGWHHALRTAGNGAEGLLVVPHCMPSDTTPIATQQAIAYEQAQRLIEPLRSGAVTAVVTANVHAGHGLMRTLQESDLRPELWPVITTFGIGDANVSMMTSMLLPWEQMGRKAADLLWSRSRGSHAGAERRISVPMRLITRLTCRPAWKMRPEAALWAAYVEGHVAAA